MQQQQQQQPHKQRKRKQNVTLCERVCSTWCEQNKQTSETNQEIDIDREREHVCVRFKMTPSSNPTPNSILFSFFLSLHTCIYYRYKHLSGLDFRFSMRLLCVHSIGCVCVRVDSSFACQLIYYYYSCRQCEKV